VRRLVPLILLAALPLGPSAVRAEPSGPAEARPQGPLVGAPSPGPPQPIVLTVSGGVSLGAWEAGFMHYTTAVMRENAGHNQVRLVTGASAGAANALMAILAEYGQQPITPEGSIFYRTWIPIGLDQLFVEDEVSRQGVFSRRWAEGLWARIEAGLRGGLEEACDVVLGVSVTRLVPRAVLLAPGVEVPRVEEHFVLRLTGRGPGRLPRVTNYAAPDPDVDQALLPEGDDGEVPLTAVRDLLLASSAFPLAFPPQPLLHCLARARPGRPLACPEAEAREALFCDGGLLDNSPIRLAVRLAGTGLRFDASGAATWLLEPRPGDWQPPQRTVFAYVSPDVAAYPVAAQQARVDGATPALALVGQLAGAFFATARAKNLLALLEERPELARTLAVPRRHYPQASAPLFAFLGFFEAELRRFDFALGMYEADLMFREREVLLARELGGPVLIARPEERHPSREWRRLECLRAALEERPEAAGACAGDDLARFRVLLQSTLFRLWDECVLEDGESRPSTEHGQCLRAMGGSPPPLVPLVPGAAGVAWRRASGEGELEHAFRILAALGFEWRDMGLGPDQGAQALVEVRRVAGQVVAALTAAQPPADRLVMGTLGSVAANSLTYGPPRWLLWATLGRELELGTSRRLSTSRHANARAHLALQLLGLQSALSSDETRVAPALLLGVELSPRFLASSTWQPSLLLRGGAVLSSHDRLGRLACPRETRDPTACTRPLVQAGLVVSVLEFARLQLTGEWYPRLRPGGPALWFVSPALGLQAAF
jgi:predicted acylesterase/phospholipase RssA